VRSQWRIDQTRRFTMPVRKTLTCLSILSILALLLSACQPPTPAGLPDNEVVQIIKSILVSIDERNMDTFTQHMSDDMKAVFTETDFGELSDLLQNTSGNYVSCADTPDLSNNQGYAIYRLNCKYDKEDVIVTVTFKTGGEQVEGLFFDSKNLRSQSK
jgi:hypothetical protein